MTTRNDFFLFVGCSLFNIKNELNKYGAGVDSAVFCKKIDMLKKITSIFCFSHIFINYSLLRKSKSDELEFVRSIINKHPQIKLVFTQSKKNNKHNYGFSLNSNPETKKSNIYVFPCEKQLLMKKNISFVSSFLFCGSFFGLSKSKIGTEIELRAKKNLNNSNTDKSYNCLENSEAPLEISTTLLKLFFEFIASDRKTDFFLMNLNAMPFLNFNAIPVISYLTKNAKKTPRHIVFNINGLSFVSDTKIFLKNLNYLRFLGYRFSMSCSDAFLLKQNISLLNAFDFLKISKSLLSKGDFFIKAHMFFIFSIADTFKLRIISNKNIRRKFLEILNYK